MTYLIARNGQTYGPYTLAEVTRYLASGNIVPNDLAQGEGMAGWSPVAELFSTPSAVPTVPAGAAAIEGPETTSRNDPGEEPRGYTAPGWTGTGSAAAGSSAPGASAPGTSGPEANVMGAGNLGSSLPGAGERRYGAATAFGSGGAARLFPDPPDLPWWLALILGLVTGGVFFVIWDVLQAAWMRRVNPGSASIFLYSAAAVLFLVNLPDSWHSIGYWLFHVPFAPRHHSGLLGLVRFGLWLAARFVLRGELLEHFNTEEPLGLRLSGFLTFLLGGLYFQFHFNQINLIKRSLRVSVPGL